MANQPPSEGIDDDFFEQILSMPLYGGDGEGNLARMLLHHSSRRGGHVASTSARGGGGGSGSGAGFPFLEGGVRPLGRGRGLVQGEDSGSPKLEDGGCAGGEGFLEAAAAARRASSAKAIFDGHGTSGSVAVVPHPPAPRGRVRAKRGQATNPHSIAERLRRERIAEKMRALQELVPNCNKIDRAALLDEIVDYVKFLRLQVKVLSMSRLGGAGTFSQLAADIPLPSLKVEASEDGSNQQEWGRWSTGAGTEQQVAKLMEKDVGAAMRFLQSNALCIVPISLAASICQMHDQPGAPSTVKPDPGAPS